MLTISAKDFGPIIEGTVNLKPLTVFVGPSNTGKSYMATLIYALMQAKGGGAIPHSLRHSRQNRHRIYRPDMVAQFDEEEVDEGLRRAIESWAETIRADHFGPYDVPFESLPAEMQSPVNRHFKSLIDANLELFASGLQRFYGGIDDFRRRSIKPTQVGLFLEQTQPLLRISAGESDSTGQICLLNQEFSLTGLQVQFDTSWLDYIRPGSNRRQMLELESVDFIYQDLLYFIISGAQSGLVQKFPIDSYYLPAARSGIAQGHRIIASTLIRQSPLAGIQRMEIPQFSGVIANFMSHLLTIGQVAVEEYGPELEESVEFLEREVVRGEINLEETGQLTYPEIYYEPFKGQPSAGKFTLNQTSSMVSELAPIILFLKYLVRSGDLLILEEPESHLHPDAQRQMARGIVRLVNAGVKVLITTHSDYLVSQINNLMRISFASDRWLKQHDFSRADCLKHDDVSAYGFGWDSSEEGSRVTELEIRKDVGIDEDEFALVANDLYEETVNFQRIRVK